MGSKFHWIIAQIEFDKDKLGVGGGGGVETNGKYFIDWNESILLHVLY